MNFDVIKKYVDKFATEIEGQPPINNELPACTSVYISWLESLSVSSVVELGAGTSPLLRLFPPHVTKTALSLGGEAGTVKGDMNTPDLPDASADLVMARHALEHSLMPLIMLSEMARISKRHVLVIVPTCTDAMANYPNHYSVFTPPAIRALARRAGLSVVLEALAVPLYDTITEDRYLFQKV